MTTYLLAYMIIGLITWLFHVWLFLNDEVLYAKYHPLLVRDGKWKIYTVILVGLWPLVLGYFLYISFKKG